MEGRSDFDREMLEYEGDVERVVEEARGVGLSDEELLELKLNFSMWDTAPKLGEIVYSSLAPEKMHLGQALGFMFLNSVADADSYFDKNKRDFSGLSASTLRERLYDYDTDTPRVGLVMTMIEKYIGSLESGERKKLLEEYLDRFEDDTFESLAWEVSEDRGEYGHEEAMEHKRRTLEPYFMMAGLLVSKEPNIKYLKWTTEVILATQIADDVEDFSEDLKEGTVNLVVGFLNEKLSVGNDEDKAKDGALRKARKLELREKIRCNYVVYGLRMLLVNWLRKRN